MNAIAVHEAAHAVIARLCDLDVARASADAADPGVTTVVPADLPPGKRDVVRYACRLLVDLAGAAAEERAFGEADLAACRADLDNARRRAARLLTYGRSLELRELDAKERAVCEKLVAIFRKAAERLVAENWPAIEAVAGALAEGRVLTGDEIEALLAGPS